ncbi:serine/threonine-protein kinase [Nonomuraea spiralis]|uniref:serine/threonine-protein kinase n=1 Tax=Nonomuraea spiralis TaxID=46182 RepID=UPI0037A917D0
MSLSHCAGWLLAGRYRLLSELGQGGMGRVWRAHDELLDRPVAVKEVTLGHAMGDERERLLGRTMREARLAARLTHPHIAAVYDVVVADERPWIVLQLVPSRSLADVIAERGPLSAPETARIGLQVLEALSAAHADGIVHRDVKPGNILLNGDRHALLTDFGLATTLDDQAHLTQSGMVVGTPAYIAPERLRGGPASPQADLWSLGATLYAAVEGHSPFPHSGHLAALTAVLTSRPAPFHRAGPLAPVIAGLLEKDPARRIDGDEARRRLTRVAALYDEKPCDTAAVPVAAALPRTGDLFPPTLSPDPEHPGRRPLGQAQEDRTPHDQGARGPGRASEGRAREGRSGGRTVEWGRAMRGGVHGLARGLREHRQLLPFSVSIPQPIRPQRWRQVTALAALITSVLVTTSWTGDDAPAPRTPAYADPAPDQVAEHEGDLHPVAVSRDRTPDRASGSADENARESARRLPVQPSARPRAVVGAEVGKGRKVGLKGADTKHGKGLGRGKGNGQTKHN